MTSEQLNIECPSCGLLLGKKDNFTPYTYPYTLCEQHYKYEDQEKFLERLRDMPLEKAMSVLNDALNIVETIGAKNLETPGISSLVGLAMKIGEVAKAYQAFLEAGGRHVPGVLLKNKKSKNPESQNESLSETGAREESSSSEPEMLKLP
jgi:hypothetical protein